MIYEIAAEALLKTRKKGKDMAAVNMRKSGLQNRKSPAGHFVL
ncbi:MAG: hypothetical protein ACD_77C00092G0006 [uncultured bacterium]|nr:MAG: hypothetical protein ACD_77C00092G0006 [uncultured bacterium]